MENIKEINLAEILSALLRKLWLIVLVAVIAGALVYAYTVNFVTPMYKSRITVYVNNTMAMGDQNVNITAADLATSQRLVLTYINILKSDKVLDAVAEKINNSPEYNFDTKLTGGAIKGMLTAASLEETEVFEVVISNKDRKLAYAIAHEIGKVAPDIIGDIVSGSSTRIVDDAKVAKAPYSPNERTNTTIGMIAGAVIAICAVVLQTLLDIRVKSEEDLALISNAPVLGLIPDLAMESKDHYGYSGYKYKAYKPYTSDSSKSDKGGAAK